MQNELIAKQYALQMHSLLNKGGVWPHEVDLPRDQKRAVIKVYKKIFAKVDVHGNIVICTK